MAGLEVENERLKKELSELASKNKQEKATYEQQLAKERSMGKAYTEQVKAKADEVDSMRSQLVRVTRQLDEEVSRRDEVEAQTQSLERQLHEVENGGGASASSPSKKGSASREEEEAPNLAKVSTKLMRVVDQWMQTKDLQQALLRGAGVNDMAFATLVNVLTDCKSLQVLDLGQNQLTMDSCSDICRLITTSPSLSFISISENLFSLRSMGYFMTAIMERQNKKKLVPLEVMDMSGNEGFIHAMSAAPPDVLMKQVNSACPRLPRGADVLVAQLMRELWRFLHYTEHPQVVNSRQDDVQFKIVDRLTIRKMDNALAKLLVMSDSGSDASASVHANQALAVAMNPEEEDDTSQLPPHQAGRSQGSDGVQLPPIPGRGSPVDNSAGRKGAAGAVGGYGATAGKAAETVQPKRTELRDPFSDLKSAFEPPKEKLKTFNLKQIVTRNGTVLMNMLERLLETTEIDARDVETDQTLMEFAAANGNMGLAKLCYRRGANLKAKSKKGHTYFNIVTKARRYDLMEFFHCYGVSINHQDATGTTALHIASANDDTDAICRLVEWGADVNLHDFRRRTPLHTASRKGNAKAAMLLLELGADMNHADEKQYTAVAHAEEKNHFALMDRLVLLGGKGNGLQQAKQDGSKSKSGKTLGQVTVTASMLKSSSLGRIGKISVAGLPGQLQPKIGK